MVVQNNLGNEYSSTTIVAAISTKTREVYPFQVFISAGDTGLDQDSVIDLQQIMTIDKTRLIKKIGKVKEDTFALINAAIKLSLDIN